MKINGIVYIVVGIIAVIGAVAAGYLLMTLGQALSVINSANPSEIPPGTDLAALQASAQSLGTMIMLGWVWVICVLLSGIFSVRLGVNTLRKKASLKVTSLRR